MKVGHYEVSAHVGKLYSGIGVGVGAFWGVGEAITYQQFLSSQLTSGMSRKGILSDLSKGPL